MNLTPIPLLRSLLTTRLITVLKALGLPGSIVRCLLLATLLIAVDNSVIVPIHIPSLSTTEETLRKMMSSTLFITVILRAFVLLLDAILCSLSYFFLLNFNACLAAVTVICIPCHSELYCFLNAHKNMIFRDGLVNKIITLLM